MSQSTILQLCRDGSSWVEPVQNKDICVLLKDTTVLQVRLKPAAPWSRVKHSMTEPLCSQSGFITLCKIIFIKYTIQCFHGLAMRAYDPQSIRVFQLSNCVQPYQIQHVCSYSLFILNKWAAQNSIDQTA